VTWFEARDFCTRRGGRLPTEAQWEYAAKGPDNLTYPWGNTFVFDYVVHGISSGGTSDEVGRRPDGASWVGAFDMSGNLWEWTSTLYRAFPYDPNDGRDTSIPSQDNRPVIRGGSWASGEHRLRTSYRDIAIPSYGDEYIGFRCVVPFEE
jgi:iron(II)-dependent oxidoreductase